MARIQQTLVTLLALVAICGGALFLFRSDIPDLSVPDLAWQSDGALDGRTFRTTETMRETGEAVENTLVFADGRFQSALCQAYCDFGWAPYRTWREGDVTHFTVTMICAEAPHTVVWHGRVTGDEITFEHSWTTRRWYWTHQLLAEGQGSAVAPSGTGGVSG